MIQSNNPLSLLSWTPLVASLQTSLSKVDFMLRGLFHLAQSSFPSRQVKGANTVQTLHVFTA